MGNSKIAMRKIASLTAVFTLAAGCMFVAAPAAQAQTVSVTPTNTVYNTTYQQPSVRQGAIDAVVNALGVRSLYRRAGKGFTSGQIGGTREHIGLEFNLNGDLATVVKAYDLNDSESLLQYNVARQEAQRLEARITAQERRRTTTVRVARSQISCR